MMKRRMKISRKKSRKQFAKTASKFHHKNAVNPQRGGYRL